MKMMHENLIQKRLEELLWLFKKTFKDDPERLKYYELGSTWQSIAHAHHLELEIIESDAFIANGNAILRAVFVEGIGNSLSGFLMKEFLDWRGKELDVIGVFKRRFASIHSIKDLSWEEIELMMAGEGK